MLKKLLYAYLAISLISCSTVPVIPCIPHLDENITFVEITSEET